MLKLNLSDLVVIRNSNKEEQLSKAKPYFNRFKSDVSLLKEISDIGDGIITLILPNDLDKRVGLCICNSLLEEIKRTLLIGNYDVNELPTLIKWEAGTITKGEYKYLLRARKVNSLEVNLRLFTGEADKLSDINSLRDTEAADLITKVLRSRNNSDMLLQEIKIRAIEYPVINNNILSFILTDYIFTGDETESHPYLNYNGKSETFCIGFDYEEVSKALNRLELDHDGTEWIGSDGYDLDLMTEMEIDINNFNSGIASLIFRIYDYYEILPGIEFIEILY